MKTCPVCKSNVFDDMQTCFGCMYTFEEKPMPQREVMPHMQPVKQSEGEGPRVVSSTRPRMPYEPGYVADDPTTHFQEFDFRIPRGCRLVFTFERSVDEYVEEFNQKKADREKAQAAVAAS